VSSNLSAHHSHLSISGAQLPVQPIRLLKPSFRILARNWWASLVWLGIIRLESTDVASSANTSGLLYTLIAAVFPHVNMQVVDEINEVLRKTGHFVGYGILAVLVFYALRNTNRDTLTPLLRRHWGTYLHDLWRMEWALIGVGVTLVTASFDEIHQSFLASRTGRWQDVVIDCCGAILFQIIIYVLSVRALIQRGDRLGQPEFSSTS
jgi:VanZ family protein